MVDEIADLFLNSLIDVPVKDDQNLMEYPHFSLQKRPRMEPFVYNDKRNGIFIEIKPGHAGMATIWDKDVLLYCQTLINDRIESGQRVDRTFHFHAYDFMRVTGRGSGKQAYTLLIEALDRLQSTSIRTSVRTGDNEVRERTGFSWIENFRVVERKNRKGREVMAAIEITINPWTFRTLVETRRVLTINPLYFDLKQGLERRLYELARKHCGHKPYWRISLRRLWFKCGSTQDLRFFKRDLKRIINKDSIPDYQISLAFDPASKDIVGDLPSRVQRRWGRNERVIVVITNKRHRYIDHTTEDL